MRAGLLRDVITLYVPSYVRNDVGELVTTYNENCKLKARVIHQTSNRAVENVGEVRHNQNQIFEVRIYNKIDDFDIIGWSGYKYRIIDISTDTQNQKKVITTEKIND